MHSLDFLHLSRASKRLRSTLLRRNSCTAWKAAFAELHGLPPCPESLSEPMYAALLFD